MKLKMHNFSSVCSHEIKIALFFQACAVRDKLVSTGNPQFYVRLGFTHTSGTTNFSHQCGIGMVKFLYISVIYGEK